MSADGDTVRRMLTFYVGSEGDALAALAALARLEAAEKERDEAIGQARRSREATKLANDEIAELRGLLDNERVYTADHRGYAQLVTAQRDALAEENKKLRAVYDAATALMDYAEEHEKPVGPLHQALDAALAEAGME